jgi:hypothetical protein
MCSPQLLGDLDERLDDLRVLDSAVLTGADRTLQQIGGRSSPAMWGREDAGSDDYLDP